ncbi:alpha/beta hydrolase [Streptomyces sp. NPDC058442]|uniref:alpha/beta hydrolase n=1 Tax=Streptomyces sp. NPDC058442 TaxID=3346503 RepID=UPI00365DFC7C
MDLKTLRALKPSEYAEAADGYRAVSDMADAARESIGQQITKTMRKANEGEAAGAAQKQLKKLSDNFHYTQVECGLVSGALNGFSSEIAAPRRRLLEALEDAAALEYPVSGNGDVTYPAGGKNELTGDKIPGGTAVGNNGMLGPGNRRLHGPDSNGLYTPGTGTSDIDPHRGNPYSAKAQDIADRIAHALREAGEIDERYSRALNKLKAAPGLKVDAKTWADAAADTKAVGDAAADYLKDDIPLDKSPAARKDWWDHLTPEQRDEYLAVYPDVIGNLDGIPATVRDEANRENLQMLIGQMAGRNDDDSQTKLAGLTGIQKKLNEGSEPPIYLLGIGDEGNGRAIVSYGNPDTAKNVSAYVPGLGTKLDEEFAEGTLARGLDTAKGAQKYDSSSAAIVWLGYDAPQNIDVASKGDAEKGAPAYNLFMSGLGATNEHENPHLTAIGHSYGSLTVGTATQKEGGIPGVGDIILLGSPGVGVDKAEDLGVGKEHVFVGSAENDPVTMLPSRRQAVAGVLGFFGGGPLSSYVAGDIADPGDDDVWFGKDPSSEAFGARRFQVDDGPRPVIDGEGPTPAHSNYFTPSKDRVSADNIALIVSGNSQEIKVDQPR